MRWFKHKHTNNTTHGKKYNSSLNRGLFTVMLCAVSLIFVCARFVQSESVSLSQGDWTSMNAESKTILPEENWTEYSEKDAGVIAGSDLHLESAMHLMTQTSDDGVTDSCTTDNCTSGGGFNGSTTVKTNTAISGTGEQTSITLSNSSSSGDFRQNLLGSLNTGTAEGIDIAGNLVYVADSKNGLQIVDITDPANPTIAGTFVVSGKAVDVAVKGKYAYVITDDVFDLQIVKINNLSNLKLKGKIQIGGTATSVAVAKKYAYVSADDPNGLQIIDINDPAVPTLAGTFATTGKARGIAVSGKYAYVAAQDKFDLQIIKINNLSNIKLKGKLKLGGKAKDIALSGNYAYMAGENTGLSIVDISDPKNPALTGSYATAGKAKGVAVVGNLVYVAMNDFGLATIDVTLPSTPALIATYDTPQKAKNVVAVNNTIYIADGKSGIHIVQSLEDSSYFSTGTFESSVMDLGSNIYDFDAVIADIDIPSNALPVGIEISPSESSLIGLWRMNTDDTSLTSVQDFAGSYAGTLHSGSSGANTSTSAMWDEAGNLGSNMYTAIEFDGTDDYVSIDHFMTGVKTIMFWINHGDPTAGDEILELNGSTSLSIDAGTGNISATGFQLPTIYVDGSSASSALTAGWHHVAVVTSTGVIASDMNLGRVVTGYMSGLLDEVAMFDRALSANEIYRIHQGYGITLQVAASDCFNGATNAPDCSMFIGWGDTQTPFIGNNGTTNSILAGPAAFYHLDEGSGTTLSDASGFGHNGTLIVGGSGYQSGSAEAWTNGSSGALANLGSQGLYFDGSDDYVSVGDIKSDIKSVEFWINHNSNNFGGVILELNPTHSIVITTANKLIASGFETPKIYIDGSSSLDILTPGWHHVAVVSDTAVNATGVNFGRVGSQYLAGSLDEIVLYNWALSKGTVKARYNNGLGKRGAAFGPLVGTSLDNKQYVKFKARLNSSSMFSVPKVHEASIGYSAFPAGAGLVSSVFDTEDANSFLTDISWSETLKDHDVRLQVATSGDGIKWNYCGSFDCSTDDWLNFSRDIGSYYTAATGSKPNSQSSNADNDRYIKYKVWLMSADGATTPTADDITITYDVAHLEVFAPDGLSDAYEAQAQKPFNIVIKVKDSSGKTISHHDGSRTIKLTASVAQPNTESCFSSFNENGNTELSQSVVFRSGEATVDNVLFCDGSIDNSFTISVTETIGGALKSTTDLTITDITDPEDEISATLYWDPIKLCADFSHYEVWYGTTSNVSLGIGQKWDDNDDPALAFCSTATTTITGLLSNTEYYFKVYAINDKGEAIPVNLISVTINDGNTTESLTNEPSQQAEETALYDVLIKLGDNIHKDPNEDARACYKHGDVVMIMPAGHNWSDTERRSFLILQMELTEEEARTLTLPEVKDEPQRRAKKVNLDQFGLSAEKGKDKEKIRVLKESLKKKRTLAKKSVEKKRKRKAKKFKSDQPGLAIGKDKNKKKGDIGVSEGIDLLIEAAEIEKIKQAVDAQESIKSNEVKKRKKAPKSEKGKKVPKAKKNNANKQ